MKILKLLLVFVSLIATSSPPLAGEGYFSRFYTTDTNPKGVFEIEQITRNRRDRSQGNYSAFDLRTEFECGFTDSFQGALYINTGHMAAKGAPDDDDVQGISTEFIYRVSSPYTDPIGFALYFEPAFDAHDLHNGLKYDLSFENEFRLI
ncbi:MAG: hypothetical protein H7333_02250, partial [Bdellovibrionales bacterium]|nr:hypothetical protein [Oligoflexia bacterium]